MLNDQVIMLTLHVVSSVRSILVLNDQVIMLTLHVV